MYHRFEADHKETRIELVPADRIQRAFLEAFVNATVRVTKTVKAESQPVFTFTIDKP